MADASKKVLKLIYRGKAHEIALEGTQADFQGLIEEATKVPRGEQTVIHHGKKITISPEAPVSELNLTQKAMLLRKHVSSGAASGATQLTPLRVAEKRLQSLQERLSIVQEAISRHTKGFLDKGMTMEALEKDNKEVRVVEEHVMKIMEDIDGMTVPETAADVWRAERRAIVKKAQDMLVTVDGVHENISELKDDRWGEVESRRGKG